MSFLSFKRKSFLLLSFFITTVAFGTERDQELRAEMWSSPDKTFQLMEVPKKWAEKSAIIIAQLNRFEYRKPVLSSLLRYNEYSHYRIKLIDKNAVQKYSEMTYLSTRYDNSEGESIKVYVGFKIIKPNGKEIIVDEAKAVAMEKEYRGQKRAYNKLAIPNLEPGDIFDYYICEEATRANSQLIYFFDPIIYTLPQEYPVMNHKLQFRAERKCYINLRSLNGAPELKLATDEANEEQYYTLEGKDIEGVDDMRWMYQYREMPTIKFRAAFASGKGMRTFDVLLGEPGVVKNSVSKKELMDMVETMLSLAYDAKFFNKFIKKKLKNEKDPFVIAKQCYYFYRNEFYGPMESNLVEGNSPWSSMSQVKFVDVFSTFLAYKKIPHDIVLAVPRNISGLNDLLIENEIEWMIRVKKGDQYLYLTPFDLNTVPGTFDALLEGTEAYAIDGLVPSKKWDAKRITLPGSTASDHRTNTDIKLDLTNLELAKASVKRSLTGRNKLGQQYSVMDLYDFSDEEKARFEMPESFAGYVGRKKYLAMKDAYLAKRETTRTERIKESVESDFNIKVKEVSDFKIEQTGRYDDAAEMIYSFNFTTEDIVKKAGPNYLIDVGKLVEGQTKIDGEELKRKNNIYFDNPRAFKYKIVIDIPKGYTVQGLDKLNQKTEFKVGGFTATAKEEKGQVIIETNKHYEVNYAPNSEWQNIVKFLNAAYDFSEQKLLLKKK
jgi:hypothetical protein